MCTQACGCLRPRSTAPPNRRASLRPSTMQAPTYLEAVPHVRRGPYTFGFRARLCTSIVWFSSSVFFSRSALCDSILYVRFSRSVFALDLCDSILRYSMMPKSPMRLAHALDFKSFSGTVSELRYRSWCPDWTTSLSWQDRAEKCRCVGGRGSQHSGWSSCQVASIPLQVHRIDSSSLFASLYVTMRSTARLGKGAPLPTPSLNTSSFI